MNSIMKFWKFFIFTNLLIAFSAAAQTLLTYKILDLQANQYVVFIEFTATLLLYNLSLWLARPKKYKDSAYERTRWIFGNSRIFWFFTIIALIGLLYSLSQLHFFTILFLAVIGVISLAYVIPVFRIKGSWSSLRRVPFFKVFHIAIIWALSTVGLVIVELYTIGISFRIGEMVYLVLCKFLFILMVTLPFDIRDIKQDSYYHLKTLPTALGVAKTQVLCYRLLALHILMICFIPSSLAIKTGMIVCDVVIFLLLRYQIFKKQDSFLSVYLLDLILVLQYLICLFIVQIVGCFIR